MEVKKFRLSGSKKWILFLYSVFSLLSTIIYIIFNHQYFRVDWSKYASNEIYQGKVDAVLKHGVFWISGNLYSINSMFLITLLLSGAILSLVIFFISWRNFLTKTWLPLVSFGGFLLPLLVHNDGNILKILVIAYLFIIFASSFSVSTLRQW